MAKGLSKAIDLLGLGRLSQSRSGAVQLRNRLDSSSPPPIAPCEAHYDGQQAGQSMSIPWALQMKAVSVEEPGRLVQTLTGAILGCGGLGAQPRSKRYRNHQHALRVERQVCVDVYSVLIAAGLETQPERPHPFY